ncbi:hypothetical protein BDV39DRAFT_167073 [Aspergillus sergii]|uniref:Uncharacterized protein n=1 Tax=Aspergillus sergii TaxID=1034303 RepID=A0A5N6XJA7_9EURO|nr:hypothetical protein BDV39DRAFT_167073 [Aspergillus sergii]
MINLDCTVREGVRLWLSVAVMKIFVTLFDLLLDIVPRFLPDTSANFAYTGGLQLYVIIAEMNNVSRTILGVVKAVQAMKVKPI